MHRAFVVAATALSTMLPSRGDNPPPIHPATVTPLGAHLCAGFYPEAAREAHLGGVASLNFHITPTGAVSNVAVVKSSGNTDLDDAAKSCVRTWRYVPVQKDGQPIEAAWDAEVEFKAVVAEPAPVAQPLPVEIDKDRDVCLRYPWWALRHHAEGNGVVKFAVTPDGGVSDITMTKSSGDKDLDEAALSCVKSLKYRPLAGAAAPKPVTAHVSWSYLEHAPSVVRWTFAGATSAITEAAQQVRSGVAQCLAGAASHSEFASGLGGITTLRVRYDRGAIEDVSVLTTSGNDALDRYGANCFKAEPSDAERAEVLRHIGVSTFHITWRQYLHP